MTIRKLFYSKRFFIFNLVLISLMAGFILSLVAFSCSSTIRPKTKVFAEDNAPLTLEDMAGVQTSFRKVADLVLPVVVELRIIENLVNQTEEERSPLEFFFGRPNQGDQTEPRALPGLGSGIIVREKDKRVYVLTNNHVAGNADRITVVLHNGREYDAKLEGSDSRKDLAIVSFETKEITTPVAAIGNSDSLYVGDWVLAIGNPFGFFSTVTAGIVSAKGRAALDDNISDFIQTDAAINQGNSGGPLVNLRGEVVGINTWITSTTGISIGYGFAIPINNAKKTMEDIIAKGEVEYGWLGVEIGDLSTALTDNLDFEERKGAVIYQVFRESPAEKGGLLVGDIVVDLNGNEVKDYRHLIRLVGDLMPGINANFTVLRQGKQKSVRVHIGLRPDNEAIQAANKNMWPGINVVPLSEALRSQMGIPDDIVGLFIQEVIPGTSPHIEGMQHGDIVLKINGAQVKSMLDFFTQVNDINTKDFVFLIIRSGIEMTFSLTK